MKKTLVLFVVLSIQVVFAQDGWQWLNPKPAHDNIIDVQFIDQNNIWAVGSRGLIMKSENSGLNWNVLSNDSANDYNKIQFTGLNTGYIIGRLYGYNYRDIIMKTTDGGNKWKVIKSTTGNTYLTMHFINSHTGFVTGYYNYILRTSNGGTTWDSTAFELGEYIYWMNMIDFSDQNNGILYGTNFQQPYMNTKIIRTTDAGLNWFLQSSDSGKQYYNLDFINSHTGFVTRNADLLKTTNKGNTWEFLQTLPLNFSYGVSKLFFRDEYNYYSIIYGSYGRSYFGKTSNAGANWEMSTLQLHRSASSFEMYENTAIIGGIDGELIVSSNSGNFWSNFNFSYGDMSKTEFISSDLIYSAGDYGKFHKSNDGGKNWTTKVIFDDTISPSRLINVKFIDLNTGYYFGTSNKLYRTADGGEKWLKLNDPGIINRIYNYESIYFINSQTGFITGNYYHQNISRGFISKTTNSGLNWDFTENVIQLFGNNLYFENELTGYSGQSNALWKTTNAGEDWFKLRENGYYSRVKYVDKFNFFNITAKTFTRTTNSGLDWTVLYHTEKNIEIRDMCINGDTYYLLVNGSILEDGNKILKSTDSGNSWSENTLSPQYDLLNIVFFNENTGYLLGGGGKILKTTNGGVTVEPPIIPYRFFLYQNYPNPFNPETSIKYELPETGYTTLKLYDINGREIKNIVNGISTRGIHEVESSLADLASGIYFVQLKQGPYIMSIKIALVK